MREIWLHTTFVANGVPYAKALNVFTRNHIVITVDDAGFDGDGGLSPGSSNESVLKRPHQDHSHSGGDTPHHAGASLSDHSRGQRAAHVRGGQAPATPAKRANKEESRAFWRSKGYSEAAIAGLLQSEQSESDWNPHNVGDSGSAVGSFQWHPDRRGAILRATGVDVASSKTSHRQLLEAADWELNNTEKSAGAKIRGAKTPFDAGYAASRLGEHPASSPQCFHRGLARC